jgi:hypothetical protein
MPIKASPKQIAHIVRGMYVISVSGPSKYRAAPHIKIPTKMI